MISIFDMALLSQYQRYQEYIFTECSLQYVGWFYAEKYDFIWVVTERVTFVLGHNYAQ